MVPLCFVQMFKGLAQARDVGISFQMNNPDDLRKDKHLRTVVSLRLRGSLCKIVYTDIHSRVMDGTEPTTGQTNSLKVIVIIVHSVLILQLPQIHVLLNFPYTP